MFEDLEVPEQAYSHQSRIAIFRFDDKSYDAAIIDDSFYLHQPFIVKDLKLTIPRSHVQQIGEKYFSNFLATAFKLMSKPGCESPLAVLKPLRKKLRRIKLRLVRINPNNSALSWYLENLLSMVKEMWLAAKNNYLRWLTERNCILKDEAILNSQIIY